MLKPKDKLLAEIRLKVGQVLRNTVTIEGIIKSCCICFLQKPTAFDTNYWPVVAECPRETAGSYSCYFVVSWLVFCLSINRR